MIKIKKCLANDCEKYKKAIISHIKNILTKELFEEMDNEILKDLSDIKKNYDIKKGEAFWIALDNNKLIGTIGLKRIDKKSGNLKRLYIKKKYRGTGLSLKMLNKVISFAKKNNIKSFYLSTGKENTLANKFYLKHNFKRIKKMPSGVNFKNYNLYKLVIK